jgi:pimeloyl-ACP methyl ester carboxylesterase
MANQRKAATLSANGIDLYYERVGSGEPLLLLHGGTGSHED